MTWNKPRFLNNQLTINDINFPLLVLILCKLVAIYLIIDWYEIEPTFNLNKIIVASGTIMLFNILLMPNTRQLGILFTTGVLSILTLGTINTLLIVLTLTGFILTLRINYHKPLLPVLYLCILVGIQYFSNKYQSIDLLWLKISGIILLFKGLYHIYYQSINNKIRENTNVMNYFFMAPHLLISLFPAIDPTKSVVSYDINIKNLLQINKKGVQWISAGLIQIILYRIIYHEYTVATTEITNIYKLSQYLITNYIIVLRLSGIFHITTGILCLMGYDMPKIFHNYFLANSLPDVWRRINIYFKDFMNTVFFNPIYFKLRIWSKKYALIYSTIIVFLVSWVIHNYQWFWIKGYFPLKINDFAFWIIFGLIVTIQTQIKIYTSEINKSNNVVQKSINISTTFLTMAILWSLWTAKDLKNWINIFSIQYTINDISIMILILAICTAILTISIYFSNQPKILKILEPKPETKTASVYSILFLFILLTLNNPISKIESKNIAWLNSIANHNKNKEDNQKQIESYYEDILTDNIMNIDFNKSNEQNLDKNQDVKIQTNDFRNIKLIPNLKTTYKGSIFTTNQLGFRYKEINIKKQINVKRYIIMGGSFTVGSGVNDNEVFSNLLEEMTNSNDTEHIYEFINTAVPSYDILDFVIHFENENMNQLNADKLIIIVHGLDEIKTIRDIARYYRKGQRLPYNNINNILLKLNISENMQEDEIVKHLTPAGNEIVKACYEEIYKICQNSKIEPIWVYWPPLVRKDDSLIDKNKSKIIVEELGFTIVDLENIYDDYKPSNLMMSNFDTHPNATGHKIFAKELYRQLIKTE